MIKKEDGIVLIITLIITLVSLSLVGAIFYLILTTTNFSSKSKTYIQTLEISKTVSKLIMKRLKNGTLKCIGNTACISSCEENCLIDLSDIASSFPDYDIIAEVKVKEPLETSDLYGIVVSAKRKKSSEKSTVSFLFKKVK